MNKHEKIRIESWCKKFCQITTNIDWKKNRNLHAIYLLNMIINQHFEEPYTKFAPDGPLPFLNKPIIKSSLSPKFLNYLSISFKSAFLRNSQKSFANRNSFNNINNMSTNSLLKRSITPSEITLKDRSLNKENHLYEIKNCNDPDLLKKYIQKLQYKVNETKKIINEQNEEKKVLLKKINQIENIIKSYKI